MIKELVRKNRSYRGYDSSYQVTKEELLDLVDCARLTPSSINRQPLRYYLAWEKEKVELIQSMTKWAAALPNLTLPHPGMCPTAFIVICQDMKLAPNPFLKDVGIVAQTILLAAVEKGLGGCMIGNFNAKTVKEKLSLPENMEVQLIVAIGKPAETVVLTEVGEDGNTAYYRDDNDVHYVPKRKLEDIIL